jgi:hypothetical protein
VTYYIHVGLDEPALYTIKLQGRLDTPLQDWFQGQLDQSVEVRDGCISVTSLTGIIADQSALHGLLRYLRDLGLPLLYVECISARREEE